MARRKYDMSRRAAQVEETKRRIVQATMELHTSQGILETGWEDIAERADVSLATVYRHFPTLDDLVPACSALIMAKLQLPEPEDVEARFADVRGRRARVRHLVDLVFGLYERAPEALAEMHRSRDRVALVAENHRQIDGLVDRVVDATLRPLDVPVARARVVRALVDYESWVSLTERGADAHAVTAELIESWLARSQR